MPLIWTLQQGFWTLKQQQKPSIFSDDKYAMDFSVLESYEVV